MKQFVGKSIGVAILCMIPFFGGCNVKEFNTLMTGGIGKEDMKEVTSGKVTVDKFEQLSINATWADVEFVTSETDEYAIEYHLWYTEEEPFFTNDDGTLEFTAEEEYNNINFSMDNYITVYVPEDAVFNDIDLDMITGNVTMPKMKVSELECSLITGDINVEQMESDEVQIHIITGNIAIEQLDVTKNLEFDDTTGNVKLGLSGSQADYSYDLSTITGDVRVAGEKMDHKYNKIDGSKSISVEMITGDITIEF